jgi:class 3 adenylate cyclase
VPTRAQIKEVETVEGDHVRMRIGIHTGKILAGVIGTRQLRFDIW